MLFSAAFVLNIGAPEGIRTPNLLIRSRPTPFRGSPSASVNAPRPSRIISRDLRYQSEHVR